jgi:hypothetical protein
VISQKAKAANAGYHAEAPMWGASASRWLDEVTAHARHLEAKTILDFGCGKGRVKQGLDPKVYTVTEYDPGIPGKDLWPSPADMVVCIDVMEHVEGPCVEATLVEIGELARTGAFMVIALYSNGAKLPNSDQAIHCTVLTPDQWLDRFAVAWQFPCHVLTQLVKKRGSASNNRNVLKVWMEKL